MTDVRLADDQWTKIRDFLRDAPNVYVGKDEQACRRFVEAVKWISPSGAQWRLLPAECGKWNSVYKRFVRFAVMQRRILSSICWHKVSKRSFRRINTRKSCGRMINGCIERAIWSNASSTRSSIFDASSPALRNWIVPIWAFCTLSAS